MIHKGAATAGKMFTRQQIKTIMQKNLFLFMWKNLHDMKFTIAHIFWLLPRLVRETAVGNSCFASGLAGALRQLPEAMRARKYVRRSKLSDSDVMEMFDGIKAGER